MQVQVPVRATQTAGGAVLIFGTFALAFGGVNLFAIAVASALAAAFSV